MLTTSSQLEHGLLMSLTIVKHQGTRLEYGSIVFKYCRIRCCTSSSTLCRLLYTTESRGESATSTACHDLSTCKSKHHQGSFNAQLLQSC